MPTWYLEVRRKRKEWCDNEPKSLWSYALPLELQSLSHIELLYPTEASLAYQKNIVSQKLAKELKVTPEGWRNTLLLVFLIGLQHHFWVILMLSIRNNSFDNNNDVDDVDDDDDDDDGLITRGPPTSFFSGGGGGFRVDPVSVEINSG